MNLAAKNPFHEAHVTDTVADEDFASYFSPFLVPACKDIFLPGNVVIKGTQGCGKSMMLRLLEPEIRLKYFERHQQGHPEAFPVPEELQNFLGARVNLTKSGLKHVIQMLPAHPTEDDKKMVARSFGDFFNYWMLRDILRAAKMASEHSDAFGGLVDGSQLDAFAKLFCSQDCLFDALSGATTFDLLVIAINDRVIRYRKWVNGNAELGSSVTETRTAIGEPLSRAADCLKHSGTMHAKGNVFLTIDQIEAFWTKDPSSMGSYLRKELNELMGRRDERVSFRLGTRRYDWGSDHIATRDGADLEDGRDYHVIDVDHLLRRAEHGKWPFASFAEDIFRRRILSAFGHENEDTFRSLFDIRRFFGPSPKPQERIESRVSNPPESPAKLLSLDGEWDEPWRDSMLKCYHKKGKDLTPSCSKDYPCDPISAVMLMAWGLQTGGKKNSKQHRATSSPKLSDDAEPWNKRWWRKERLPQLCLQIIGRHNQRMYWWGWKDVLGLSGSNALWFLRICREVWRSWQRLSVDQELTAGMLANSKCLVPMRTQWLAIDAVSSQMHDVFEAQPGRPAGDVRMRFLGRAAGWLRTGLMNDKALSNPGQNGFTLSRSELESHPGLKRLIEEAVGWGELYEVAHTSKSAGENASDPRRKFYLNPILSPFYQLPDVHTKEPVYNAAATLASYAEQASQLTSNSETKTNPQPAARLSSQLELPWGQA